MAFDPDKYLAKFDEFDPDQYIKSKAVPKAEVPASSLEALYRGAVSSVPGTKQLGAIGGTIGELLASMGSEPVQATNPETQARIAAMSPEQPLIERYRANRDRISGENTKLAKDSPIAYGAGQMAGGVLAGGALGAVAPAMPAIEAAALYGGAQGLSDGKADLTKGEVGQAIQDAGIGAGLGAAGGAIGEAAGSALSKLGGMVGKTSVAKGYQLGKEGTDIATEAGRKAVGQKPYEFAEDLLKKYPSLTPELGKNSPEQLGTLIRQLESAGQTGDVARFNLKKGLEEVAKSEPEFAKSLGNKIKNIAKEVATSDKAAKEHLSILKPVSAVSSLSTSIGNVAGQANRKVNESVVEAAKAAYTPAKDTLGYIPHKLSQASNESLQAFGTTLLEHGSELEKKLGQLFFEASTKDQVGRNAVIFSLLQNPSYNAKIKELFNVDKKD